MQILSTKLSIPPKRSRLVERTQLIQKLNQGLEHGFVLVSAPAGYGKSTLLSEWLGQVNLGSTWLSLDERDNDLSRFLGYLAAALRSIDPTIDKAFENKHSTDLQPEVETLLTPLINHLAQIEHPFWLILDDYHVIRDKRVHQVISFLIEHRPEPFHLVIATRADPPLPLAKLRAQSAMLELRQVDLCFTLQEASDFLNHTMGVQISSDDIHRITTRTEGWIAGLQMAALSMQRTDDIPGFINTLTGNHHYVFDYLLEEILGRQSPEIRRFLLYTSIVDQLSAGMCDALLQENTATSIHRSSAAILNELEQANLFILPLDDERRWYRYHHLFSDLLKLILEQTHPGVSVELHHRACRWYEAQDMLPEALQHAISSGDMQLVAQIISANVMVLVESNEIAPILKKIDSLPPGEMVALPWLGIARAWALGAGQVQKSQQVLDAVEKSMENKPDDPEYWRLKGHIAAARAFVLGAEGDKSIAIALAREANELLPADEIAVRAMNLTIWGDLLDSCGNDLEALPILEQALVLARQVNKAHMVMVAAASLASTHLFAGRLFEAQRVCLEALLIAEDHQRRFQHPISATAEVYSLLARVLAEWGENEKAIQYAYKGLQLSERWGRINSESLCLAYLGRALMFNNDQEQGQRALERADMIAQKISPHYWREYAVFTLESMLDCETPDVRAIAQLKHRLKESDASVPDLLQARLLLMDNQPEKALEALEQAISRLRGQPSLDTARIYGLRALAYQVKGDEQKALIMLRQALDLAEPENRIATFVREGVAMEKLLRLAGAKSDAPAFIQRLLAAFGTRRKHNQVPALASEGLFESLSNREMEILRLLAQGHADKKIAETLVIARETVHKHLKNIYGKLDVHSRTEAIIRARELGLV